ncbi:TPM domain-containing protein [Thermaurantiacus sp.]
MQVPDTDHERVAAAIAAAEATTSGEIVCVLDTDRHIYLEWVLALAAALAFTVPLLLTLAGFGPTAWRDTLFPAWQAAGQPLPDIATVELHAAAQVLVFLAAFLLLRVTPIAQRYAPAALRRARVHELALKQFLARGIHLTAERTGVLIFASLHDQMAEIVADEGIYAKVSPDVWGEADAALLAEARRGNLAQGFVRAVGIVGAILAEHFPPAPRNRDELPNRLIEL